MLVAVPKVFSLFTEPGKIKAPACPQQPCNAGRGARMRHCSMAVPRKTSSVGLVVFARVQSWLSQKLFHLPADPLLPFPGTFQPPLLHTRLQRWQAPCLSW